MTLSKGLTVTVGEGDGTTSISFPALRHVMNTSWRENASCADLPKAVFFDYQSGTTENKKQTVALAMETCKGCKVRSQCYEFSVLNNEPFGIWAGTYPNHRKRLFRQFKVTGILEPQEVA